jgi:hypothetical protein
MLGYQNIVEQVSARGSDFPLCRTPVRRAIPAAWADTAAAALREVAEIVALAARPACARPVAAPVVLPGGFPPAAALDRSAIEPLK